MGYTTDFEGRFNLDRPLKPEHAAYLKALADTRRMVRDETRAAQLPDPIRVAASLPIGRQAQFFVGGTGMCGQDHDASVIHYNHSPIGQPGLWCKWQPTEDGAGIEWNGVEKFYSYVEWLAYLIEHFLRPWGYVLSGSVKWFGEDDRDRGTITVTDNVITTVES